MPRFLVAASLGARVRAIALALPLAVLAACGDSPSGPEAAAQRMARRFDRLADSLGQSGSPDASSSAMMMAEVLRMSNRLNTVTLTVDGEPRSYNALLLQFSLPETIEGGSFGQVVIGWKGEALNEGFAFFADTTGTFSVAMPDVEDDLPRVFGGMFEGGTSESGRAFVASSGTVVNARAAERGGCARSQVLPPSADYACSLATMTFRANVSLRELDDAGEPVAGAPARTLIIDGQTIAGIALTINALPEGAGEFSPRKLMPMPRP